MIRFLYNLLFPVALLFFLPGYLVKMFRRGNYREKFGQRLGLYDRATRSRLIGTHSWIHAVSVGEVTIALKLATAWKKLEPDLQIVLTTTTTTGFAFARQRAPEWIEVVYMPLDFWPIMRRAFRVIRPARIVLVEAEVWPNLTAIAHRKKIPLALVNARLSPQSEARFRRFIRLVRPIFRRLDLISVPAQEDVDSWIALGVEADRVHAVGSIKFDPDATRRSSEIPRQVLHSLGISAERPVLLGGSTHEGEEEILARVYKTLRAEFPTLFLIIAPRHIERTNDIAEQFRRMGLRVGRRTESRQNAAELDCLLLDTTGELANWYSVATVVFIGKSLTAHGGQNPVEAILANRPVIFGPHMENFLALAKALTETGGALQPNDESLLAESFAALFRDQNFRGRLVNRAHETLACHRGATLKTATLLHDLRAPN